MDLDKLDRLKIKNVILMAEPDGQEININNIKWLFGILRCKDKESKFYWSNHIINIPINQVYENHLIHYKTGTDVCTFYVMATYEKIWINMEYLNPNSVELECVHLFYI